MTAPEATGASAPRRPGWKLALLAALLVAAVVLVLLGLAEGLARVLEPKPVIHGYTAYPRHPVLGWTPPIGKATVTTHEFEAHYDVNALGMNDEPVERSAGARTRLLALGDSHTFAVGVSRDEAWPNVLEGLLGAGRPGDVAVYNAGVVGYSLGQYLLRMRELAPALEPQLVLVGFSMATDLQDLIPPRLGGFIYGHPWGRVYFDLDEAGKLIELHDLIGKDVPPRTAGPSWVRGLRTLKANSALVRRFRRSKLAMSLAGRLSGRGVSLWQGTETAVLTTLDEPSRYRWQLATALIEEIAREARADGRSVVLVGIPYLAQVYDEVWEASFGVSPERFDRFITGRRLDEICRAAGIGYVDTTQAFVDEARRTRTWLHFRDDAHPTVAGQRVIAEVVARYLRESGQLEAAPPNEPARVAGQNGG